MKINLPTKLTLLRLLMIPICMVVILYLMPGGGTVWRIVAAALFGLTALTDMLDGKLARKLNMVTDFGKFLDPLADKMMIIGVMLALLATMERGIFCRIFGWALFLVILRELAVTSLRMIASNKSGAVIAASLPGKIKTTLQIICVLAVLLEPLLPFPTYGILSYATTAAMAIMTLWSGVGYFKTYWLYINPNK